LKRNSRYLTQAIPPDTIFVTLTARSRGSCHWIDVPRLREFMLCFALCRRTRKRNATTLRDPLSLASFLSLSFSRLASIRQRPVLPWYARVDCPPSSASGGVFLCCAVHSGDARAVTNNTRVRAVPLHPGG
jgi:hypothetical protein